MDEAVNMIVFMVQGRRGVRYRMLMNVKLAKGTSTSRDGKSEQGKQGREGQ